MNLYDIIPVIGRNYLLSRKDDPMQTLNNSEIRKANRRLITETIFRNPGISQSELLEKTGMGNHTLITIIKELTEANIITRGTPRESTGGRPAGTLKIAADARYALGACFEKGSFVLCLVDFCSQIRDLRKYPLPGLENETSLYNIALPEDIFKNVLPECAKNILSANHIPSEKVIGLALNVKGWIEGDIWHCGSGNYRTSIIRSAIEEKTGLRFILSRDDITVGMTESWNLNLENMTSLLLEEGLGGVVITHGQIDTGSHGRSGNFAHMTLYPGGKKCICGKKGCFGAYCSAFSLLGEDESLHHYFALVSEGDRTRKAVFDQYLDDLALGISNLIMISDRPVILSGIIASYLSPYMDELKSKVRDHALSEAPVDVRLGTLGEEAPAKAAACHQLQHFFRSTV